MALITDPFQIPELRFKVALDTPIPELAGLCAKNRDWNVICNDDQFWRLRLKQDFPKRWKLKGKTWKETYRFWYLAKVKSRPFGYYPDDQQVLDTVKYTGGSELLLFEYKVNGSVKDSKSIMSYLKDRLSEEFNDPVPLFDAIIINDVDRIQFVSTYFKYINLDRLNMTLSEAFDLLFYISGNINNQGLTRPYVQNKTKVSILSSLNSDQLYDFLGEDYNGFPDHPSMLHAAIVEYHFHDIDVGLGAEEGEGEEGENEENRVTPEYFNQYIWKRYDYIKRFELDKIVWIWRSYFADTDGYFPYPPYLFVACCEPDEHDVQFETWYEMVNEDNYMTILSDMCIKNNDKPTYRQALARMTLYHNITWVTNYSPNFVANALGIPRNKVGSVLSTLLIEDRDIFVPKFESIS